MATLALVNITINQSDGIPDVVATLYIGFCAVYSKEKGYDWAKVKVVEYNS